MVRGQDEHKEEMECLIQPSLDYSRQVGMPLSRPSVSPRQRSANLFSSRTSLWRQPTPTPPPLSHSRFCQTEPYNVHRHPRLLSRPRGPCQPPLSTHYAARRYAELLEHVGRRGEVQYWVAFAALVQTFIERGSPIWAEYSLAVRLGAAADPATDPSVRNDELYAQLTAARSDEGICSLAILTSSLSSHTGAGAGGRQIPPCCSL